MVSATPYNIYTLLEDQTRIVDQKKFIKASKKEGAYQGLKKLREQGKIICDPGVKKLFKDSDTLFANGFSKEFVLVIFDYLDALKRVEQERGENSSETQLAIKQCIDKKKACGHSCFKGLQHYSSIKGHQRST